jgi:TRAP transporter TAXI family solute receptor
MKKQIHLDTCISVFVVFLIIISAVLPAVCEGQPSSKKGWPAALSIGTAGVGGAFYVLGVGFSEMIKKYVGIDTTAEVTGGGVGNVRMMSEGKLEFGFLSADTIRDAWHGSGLFANVGKQRQLRLTLGALFACNYLITRADTGIETVPQMRGRKWNTDWKGSQFTQNAINAVLDAYNMTRSDIKLLPYVSHAENVQALKEKKCDVISIAGYSPSTPAVIELATMVSVKFIPIDKDAFNKVAEKYPFFKVGVLPAGSYKGQDKDVNLLTVPCSLYTDKKFPEDLIYQIVKAILDHTEEKNAIHPSAKDFSPVNSLVTMEVPVHPGAEKYFKEKGVWTKEIDNLQKRLLKEAEAQ